MAAPKIFVSHSSKDAAFATKLVNDLNAAGAQAWMDQNDMAVGSFPERISDALDACDWFLLVLTQNALESLWVRLEVNTAIYLKHQGQICDLIIVKAEDANLKPPALWRTFLYFDAVGDYTDALARTLLNIGLSPLDASLALKPTNAAQTTGTKKSQSVKDDELKLHMLLELAISRGEWHLERREYKDALLSFQNAIGKIEKYVLHHLERFTANHLSEFKDQYSRVWAGVSKVYEGLGAHSTAQIAQAKAQSGWDEESQWQQGTLL